MPIQKAIKQNKRIVIRAYTITNTIEKKINEILTLILVQYGCRILLSPIYTCIKELLVNAVKANLKNIYFENYSVQNDLHNMSYETSLRLFKLEMSRSNAQYLSKLARENGISTTLTMWIDHKGVLNCIIENPVQMTQREQLNVRQKLKDARECHDISEYFHKIHDDPHKEGAGLGLVLVSLILKSLGVQKKDFKIIVTKNTTRVELRISLNNNTLTIFRKNIA